MKQMHPLMRGPLVRWSNLVWLLELLELLP